MMNNRELYQLASKYIGGRCPEAKRFCGLGSSDPYCCAFVTYIFDKGGDASLWYGGKKVVYVPTAETWCRANLAEIPLYLAMPMDVVTFDWNGNGVPDHIGFVRDRKSDTEIYTIEGNTSGGIVACKTRPVKYVSGVFRPHFKGSFNADKPLVIDGQFGYSTIACLRKALGMKPKSILSKQVVKKLQAKVGVAQDGSWGTKTSKAIQRELCGFKGNDVDGWFGEKSVKALQEWINSVVFPTAKKSKYYSDTVKIGQACCNEFGGLSGGKAGDQTGKEVCITNWSSSYDWIYVFRAKDEKIRDKLAQAMIDTCRNDNIGYNIDAPARYAAWDNAEKNGHNIKGIDKKGDTTCSEAISMCMRAVGIPKGYAPRHCDVAALTKAMKSSPYFECFTSKAYTQSAKHLLQGDILLSSHHAAMVVKSPNAK